MQKLSDHMINTLLAFDAYEYGAMTGHVIKAWMHQLATEVKASRAQLAAEASAVETLGKVEANLRSDKDAWVTAYVNADGHSFLIERNTSVEFDEECGNGITATGDTLLAALRALTEAESNSPASEVRE